MLKYLGVVLSAIFVDFYLFPLAVVSLGGANTKMLMAAIGVILVLLDGARHKNDFLNNTFIYLTVWAVMVSLCGLTSMVINNTTDTTYATYVISMWVWIFAAFVVVKFIYTIHGHINIKLLANYLTGVCTFQCLWAIGLEYNSSFQAFISTHNFFGLAIYYDMGDSGRMQGLGCAVDPAGIRFAACLIILGYVTINRTLSKYFKLETSIYLISFVIITIIGNMISRTTSIGTILVILYWLWISIFKCGKTRDTLKQVWYTLLICLVISLPILIYYYDVDSHFRENLRFGFEGFFSLVEQGSWKVSSNERLKEMIVWPDNLRTWIIGDGYFSNPSKGKDPYYIGEIFFGFYKNTDIGYIRFIYYFGVIGLLLFIGFFIYATKSCISKFPKDKLLFISLLILNFIIWSKVSTDIFTIFALFLAATPSLDNSNVVISVKTE